VLDGTGNERYEVVHDDDGLLNGAEDTVYARLASGSLSSSVDELYPFQGREPVALNVEASRLWNGRLKRDSS